MRFTDYLKDKAVSLLLQTAGMMALSFFLLLTGNTAATIFIILTVWTAALLIRCGVDYWSRSKYFCGLFHLLDTLDKRYLLSEVMPESPRLQDRLYREILRFSNKSVIEKINETEDARRDYKEYIESWVHEVKTPITAMQLICENHRDETTRKIRMELAKVDNQVEMALYYARLEQANKDYLIHSVDLKEPVKNVILRNRAYLIQNQMQVELHMEETSVSTDEKWVEFLLNQVISNCIKYRQDEDSLITISTVRKDRSLLLVVEDNGMGIPKDELGRIFEKGFTGKKGRSKKASTGIGLYLCSRLCEKLSIGLRCESEEGAYTRMIFIFPDTDFSRIGA